MSCLSKIWGVMYNSKIQFLLRTWLICGSLFSYSCETKVSEKRAQTYHGEYSADQIVQINTDFDNKIQQIQSSVEQIKMLLEVLQKNLNQSSDSVFLSVFDVVNQYNKNLSNQMPQFSNQKLYLDGHLKLKLNSLSDECQWFNYLLYSPSVMPLEVLEYKMSSCFTAGELINIMNVQFKNNKMNLVFNSENVKQLLPEQYLRPEIPECEIPQDTLRGTHCKNVVFGQSSDLLWKADIEIKDKLTAWFTAQSKTQNQLKAKGKIVVNSQGSIETFELNPIENGTGQK